MLLGEVVLIYYIAMMSQQPDVISARVMFCCSYNGDAVCETQSYRAEFPVEKKFYDSGEFGNILLAKAVQQCEEDKLKQPQASNELKINLR